MHIKRQKPEIRLKNHGFVVKKQEPSNEYPNLSALIYSVYDKKINENIAEIVVHLGKERLHIQDLFVHEDYRKKGIATCLVEMILRKAEKLHCPEVSVNPCAAQNELEKNALTQEKLEDFYKKFTYKRYFFCKRRQLSFKTAEGTEIKS